MFKEYALYKANRDMLDKKYCLKSEEQRLKDIEFIEKVTDYKHQLEIEMENSWKSEIEQIEKKADEAAMMRLDEIHQEVQPRISMLSAKTTTKIATWNVRTLYQTGKLSQVIKEFEFYNLAILGVTEMRWTGSGKIRQKDKTILYSGPGELPSERSWNNTKQGGK